VNKLSIIAVAFLSSVLSAPPAALAAGITDNLDYRTEFGLSNDDVERGLSQTAGAAGGYGELNIALGDFYADGLSNNVAFTTDKTTTVQAAGRTRKPNGKAPTRVTRTTIISQVSKAYEFDLSGGWSPSAWGNQFDIGVTYTAYYGGSSVLEKPSMEIYASASHPLGDFEPGVELHYTPSEENVNSRYVGAIKNEVYAKLNAKYKFGKHIIASASVGSTSASGDSSSQAKNFQNYTNLRVDLEYVLNKHVSFELAHSETDSTATNFYTTAVAGSRTTAGLKVGF
jgi:hypothetical protein